MVRWSWVWATLVATGLGATPALAEIVLPPGFTTEVYVTGRGFEPGEPRAGVGGIRAVTSLALDGAGRLYLGRAGWRFRGGIEGEELSPLYRVPPGGARLTPATESSYVYGPPLPNPQVGAIGAGGEVWVTTYDRDRRIGALYRMADRRPVLFAGGTPPAGGRPLLRQPEGVAVDGEGRLYVADYEGGVVVQFDATGRTLAPRYLTVPRPRALAVDGEGRLWVGADGIGTVPWSQGSGQIWTATRATAPTLVLEGPMPLGMSLGAGGVLFVAQRRTGEVFALAPGGRRADFARATEGTFLRGLAFAPVTPETRRAGIAGDLFLITVSRQVWSVNEVLRISGPFGEWTRRALRTSTP